MLSVLVLHLKRLIQVYTEAMNSESRMLLFVEPEVAFASP